MAANDIKVKISADNSGAMAELSEFVVGVQSIVHAINNMSTKVNASLRTVDASIRETAKNFNALSGSIATAGASSKEFATGVQVLVSAINNMSIRTNANLKRMNDTLKQTARGAKDTAGAVQSIKPLASNGNFFSGLLGGLAQANLAAQGILSVLGQIKDVSLSVVMPGFEFASELESSRLSLAGMISSMGKVNGEAVSFDEALQYADTLMARLNQDAIRTAANTQELVQTMTGIIAPGLGQGMNLDQIEQITTKYVNIAKAMNLPSNQFVQEIRDLITGGIRPASSQIATAAGITDATLKEIRESSETVEEAGEKLADLLLNKLFPTADQMMNLFPKTFSGILSQIEEFGQWASKAFMDTFGDEVKLGLESIRDLLGTIETDESGNEVLKVNPAILDFVDNLKEAYIWLLEVIDAARDMYSALGESKPLMTVIDVLAELFGLLKDVWLFLRKCEAALYAFLNSLSQNESLQFFFDGLSAITEKLREMYKWARAVLSALGKDLDVYIEEELKESGKEKSHLAADARARLEAKTATTTADGGNIGQVRGGSDKQNEKATAEMIKASQSALKQQVAALKAALDAQVRAFKNALEGVTVAFKQNLTGWQEMSLAEAEFDVKKEQAEIDSLTKQLEATEAATYRSDEERAAAIQRVQIELDKHRQSLERNMSALEDVRRVIGEAARRGGINGSVLNGQAISDLGKAVAQAGNALVDRGVTYDELVCTQLVAKSWDAVGLEDALHKAGVDTTDEAGNDMRNWVPALYEVAEKLGALHFPGEGYTPREGDAGIVYGQNHTFMFTGANTGVNSSGRWGGDTPANYIDDVEEAYGGEFDAIVDFQKLCIAAGIESADAIQSTTDNLHEIVATTEAGLKAVQRRSAARKEALDAEKDYFAIFGDIFTVPAQMLQETYTALKEKLENNGFAEAAAHIDAILRNKLNDLKLDQIAKNLEYFLSDLQEAAEIAAGTIAAGFSNAPKLAGDYGRMMEAHLTDLYAQLRKAIASGNVEQQRKIRELIKQTQDTLTNMVSAFASAVEENASWQTSMVNANGNLTNLQKDYAGRVIEANKNYQLAETYAQGAIDAERAYQKALQEGDAIAAQTAQNTEAAYLRQEALFRRWAEFPSYMNDLWKASKQAIEDGLVTFLTDGINKAESLSDALRDLATSILQTMQRVSAEYIVKDIMGLFTSKQDQAESQGQVAQFGGAVAQMQGYFSALLSENQGFVLSLNEQIAELESALTGFFSTVTAQAQAAAASISSVTMASGSASGYASGGLIRGEGTGTSDSIHALLSNGEYVIRAAAVKRYGANMLERINNGTFGNIRVNVPAFSGGGLVGDAGAGIADRFAATFSPNVSVPVYIDGQRIFDAHGKGFVSSEVKRQMVKNAKSFTEITKRMR